MDSSHSKKISDQYIEALADVEYLLINRKDLKATYESSPELKDEYF
ncbi:MAG: hypothetical protein AAFY45_23045 [Bacteroidota bacterium]